MIMDQDDRDNEMERNKVEATRKMNKEVLQFQRMQAGEVVPKEGDGANSVYGVGSHVSYAMKKRAKHIGGPMNQEEIRMNKELLKEIAKMKKSSVIDAAESKRGTHNTSP